MIGSPPLRIQLLGPPSVGVTGQGLVLLEEHNAEQLLCYLLVHHHRRHLREAIATILWPDETAAHCRRNIRQTLWKLKVLIGSWADQTLLTLTTDARTVQLDLSPRVWVDLREFERTALRSRNVPIANVDRKFVAAMERATQLYRGGLLEGWYQDWIVAERERLLQMQLGLLDALVAYHGLRTDHDRAISFGEMALQLDQAREGTHQQIIQLHLARGDRIAALRQYDRCEVALSEDVGASPAPETARLVKDLRNVQREEPLPIPSRERIWAEPGPSLQGMLKRLREDVSRLYEIESVILQDISTIERTLAEGTSHGSGISSADRRKRDLPGRPTRATRPG